MASNESNQAVSEANNHLAVNLHKLLAKEGKNVFFSPFSLSTALAMLFCGTEHETAEEMRNVLGYTVANLKDEDLKSSFQQLLMEFEQNPDSYTLACANSVLSHKDFAVREEFELLLVENFKAMMKKVDFINDSEKVVKQVNDWVCDKTNNMIPEFLKTLNPATVMILLNAVYFKGFWLHQFKKESTRLQNFYNKGQEDNIKQVDMMHLKKKFPYAEKETYKALRLPYKGGDISMLILLPNSKTGLAELESSLNSSFIQELSKDMSERKVEVALPKFRLEYSKSLKEQFQSLGMNRAFSSGAHFGKISDSEKLLISEIIHKAVLVVNEEGAEAAAVTAVMMMRCALVFDPEFIVDHPFMFVIYNNKNNLILFMGKVAEL